jgi:hypothetical protein
MAHYVKLTDEQGSLIWVNLSAATIVYAVEKGSEIYFPGDGEPLKVQEDCNQVITGNDIERRKL